ncbi:hypothetical protein ACSBL2_17075 [Pedobacter sp. AW31-3R]|uniref:hypothetical protein n=1 Tax=Pedobacter sp. AW31-3R TaxID=3445781 RepID=UPI003FA0FC2B
MCGKFSFLAYSEAQNRVLQQLNGIIIYPFTETGIPEFVHFMPETRNRRAGLSTYFKRRVRYLPEQFYVLYFNPIRWVLPDLASTMRSLTAFPVEYGKHRLNFLISYGCITFDVTPNDIPPEPEETLLLRVPLFLFKECFYIKVMDSPEMMGVPKLFEKVEFNW